MTELRAAARPAAARADSRDEKALVRALIEDWAQALSIKDSKRVVAHYAPDAVLYTLAPPLRSTRLDAQNLQAWFDTWKGSIEGEARDVNLSVGDGEAFCSSLNRMRGTKTDGQAVDLWFRQTLGFRKIDGAWKIVHEHTSVPFYMDGSFRAAIDLKP
jgi:ketosteroid isomerase-like protein